MEDLSMANLFTTNDITGISTINGEKIRIKGSNKAFFAVESFSKYGLITFSKEDTFKSSKYSYHFIKPIAKLKELYNLGDEMLILCCNDNFTNFKSRAKDYIDMLMTSMYRNRLDKITCFLIDDCDNIVELVKQDRIENPDARLIVPFTYDELKRGLTEEALQSRLRSFLYERDLFGIATPLHNENMFFGKDRTNIISELFGKYQRGEHGGLFGLRRIGKTSVLNILQKRVEESSGVSIYFDCSKYHHFRWNDFLRQIIKEIIEKYRISLEEYRVNLPSDFAVELTDKRYIEQRAKISFEEDLKQLYTAFSNKRILLIFDEIEQISFITSPSNHWKKGNDSLYFWQALRSISQTDNMIFSFIITGVNPTRIELSKINTIDNPIFGILTPNYISLFEYNDIKTMVSEIGGHLGLKFDEEIYSKLIEDYGGHPFLTRQICSKINNDVLSEGYERPYTVSKYNYEFKSNEYQSQMHSVITQILGVLEEYYPQEYELLKTLALNGSNEFKKKLTLGSNSCLHLEKYCLIQKDSNQYFVRIRSIGNYLNEKYKNEAITNSVSDQRAQVTIRRGNIEDQLRELILNNLKIKYGKKAHDRLIEIIKNSTKDQNQLAKLQSLDLRNSMRELYFSQLKILISKDWSSYQTIFSDKFKFEHMSEIINQYRIDAHAKSLDEEEEAILRYAFKYFESCLS